MNQQHKLNIVAFIFARKGSKGLKGKNLKKIDQKYLIDFSISTAKKLGVNEIVVSSNIKKLLKYSKKQKIFTINRPEKLCLDSSSEYLAWKHAVNYYQKKNKKIDIFISLPLVTPLRKTTDTKKALNYYIKNLNKLDVLISVNKSDAYPNFNLLVEKKKYLKLLSKDKIFRRQDGKPIYKITPCFYISNPKYILSNNHFLNGKIQGYEVDKLSSIDINDDEDYQLCKIIYKSKYKNKKY